MAQTLGDLPVGAKVKAENSKWYGQDLIFRKLGEGHSQDPADSVILQTNDIITVRCFDAAEPTNSNSNRKSYGNNRYLHSNLLQWLNSDAGANTWYTAQHTADQAPDSANVRQAVNPYDTQAGFMNGFTTDFKNSLLTVTKRTVKNTVTDGGGYEDVQSKFFLLSTTEVGFVNSIAEGSMYSLFSDSSKRIMVPTTECANNSVGYTITAGAAWYWWLRTPYPSNSISVQSVNADGILYDNDAYRGYFGVAPACAISKDQKVSDTVDEDGCYTLIYGPKIIDKPTMSTTSYKATKSEITPKLDGYDSSTMILSGDTSATDIGFYTLSITPKEGCVWSDDSSADPVDFEWDIYDVGVIKRNNIVYGDTSELENRIKKLEDVTVESQIGYIEATDTATSAHTVGSYFINKSGQFVKTTSAIAVGDIITIGTNCQATDIAEVLTELNSKIIVSPIELTPGSSALSTNTLYVVYE